MKKDEIIDYINKLENYRGYVQFSHRAIDKEKDIFVDKSPQVKNESGFIYEAHFCNGKDSVSIKQVNDSWLIDKTKDVSMSDTQTYISDIQEFNYKIKMAQVWEEKIDDLCETMPVKKLKKVVFAGFEKGESK